MDNSSFCFLWAISVWFHFHHMGHETKHLQIRKKVSYFVLHRRERWRCLSFCGFAFCLFADFVDVIAVFFFFFFVGFGTGKIILRDMVEWRHTTRYNCQCERVIPKYFPERNWCFLASIWPKFNDIHILGLKFDGSLWLKDC